MSKIEKSIKIRPKSFWSDFSYLNLFKTAYWPIPQILAHVKVSTASDKLLQIQFLILAQNMLFSKVKLLNFRIARIWKLKPLMLAVETLLEAEILIETRFSENINTKISSNWFVLKFPDFSIFDTCFPNNLL